MSCFYFLASFFRSLDYWFNYFLMVLVVLEFVSWSLDSGSWFLGIVGCILAC